MVNSLFILERDVGEIITIELSESGKNKYCFTKPEICVHILVKKRFCFQKIIQKIILRILV